MSCRLIADHPRHRPDSRPLRISLRRAADRFSTSAPINSSTCANSQPAIGPGSVAWAQPGERVEQGSRPSATRAINVLRRITPKTRPQRKRCNGGHVGDVGRLGLGGTFDFYREGRPWLGLSRPPVFLGTRGGVSHVCGLRTGSGAGGFSGAGNASVGDSWGASGGFLITRP